MKLFRIAAYVLLLVFAIDIGDGPFGGNALAEQPNARQVFLLAGADGAADTAPEPPDPHVSHGSIDETLNDLADMPRHPPQLRFALPHSPHDMMAPMFESAATIPLERPPSSMS
jgi:hypothetical protein